MVQQSVDKTGQLDADIKRCPWVQNAVKGYHRFITYDNTTFHITITTKSIF